MARIIPFHRKPTLVQAAQAQTQQAGRRAHVSGRRLDLIVRGWARCLSLVGRGQRPLTHAGQQAREVEGLGCS